MSFKPHCFGRYTILDPIAVGGMAEIYRARLTNTSDAPDRILIIKKIIANLSQNSDFVDMFEGEIKITVGLSHPNIVQIYDYGRVDGVSFLAMEYVEGKNLRQFLKRLISMKSMFSVDMSCYIVSQVCNALGYAHAFKDRMTGEHLGIVHRDVSPQNVMISYDGAVKLFDFGIAKAKSASEATQAGVIKGKPSYLSPEQIAGEVLDGRSDIFSLGIVLWEMLTAKRLFVADNDMAILRMIQSAKIEPPSTYNPAIPQALDAIVLRSLARDRDKRYRSGEEMQRDLHRFLYSYNPGFNPADLSYYATELFKKEIQEDRDRLRASLKITPDPYPPNGPKVATKKEDPSASNNKSTPTEGLVTSNEFNREVMEDMLMTRTSHQPIDGHKEIDIHAQKLKPTTDGKIVQKSGSLGKSRISASPHGISGPMPPKAPKGEDLVIPPWVNQSRGAGQQTRTSNEISMDRSGKRARTGSRSIAINRELNRDNGESSRIQSLGLVLVGLIIVLVAGVKFFPDNFSPILEGTPLASLLLSEKDIQRDLTSMPNSKSNSTNQQKIIDIANPAYSEGNTKPEKNPISQPPGDHVGIIHFESNVEGFQVTINGKPTRIENNSVQAPVGIDLDIEVSKPGFDPKLVQTKLDSTDPRTIAIVLGKIEKGTLTFITNPGADITLRSKGRHPLSLYTPLRNYELPTGEYEATIENTRIGHKSKMNFKIEKGKNTSIEKDL